MTGDRHAHAESAHLTIGYSTTASRLDRVADLPAPPVASVVVVQDGEDGRMRVDDAPATVRERSRVDVMHAWGVAKSRNRAMDLCATKYLVFGDDDVEVAWDTVLDAVARMRERGLGVALGYGVDASTGRSRKRHPSDFRPLSVWNSARAATYEMIVDVEQLRAAGVRFDERFGAGAPLPLGDEYLVIVDAVRAGVPGESMPLAFGIHPHVSSGSNWTDSAHTRSRAAVFARVFGIWGYPVRAVFALRHARDWDSLAAAWTFVARPPHL